MNAPPEALPRTLIDELLDKQRRLTPVERFARKHQGNAIPAQARYYNNLIPQSKPAAGQQYAFTVDLDACTGCKACVSACHSLNGLDEGEVWRNVGLIHGGSLESPYQQTVTTTCHHCVEPACLKGCPVAAYDKDAVTGIVLHLDDQCIGCQYCMLKCPYDVPKYSERLGIVRKCDMCIGRLAGAEAPACVQACPHEAITITLVEHSAVVGASTSGATMLPGAFDSSYTKPTTHFASRKSSPANARPANADELRLEKAHWPLVFMLLLTQAAAGLFGVLALGAVAYGSLFELRGIATAGWVTLHAGLGVSVLHLGRPLGAWRFFLGLRTSWMSREILAFGVFSVFATLTTALAWLLPDINLLATMATITTASSLVGVFTSAMIYIDTRRPFWSPRLVVPQFFGTTLLLGTTISATFLSCVGNGGQFARIAAVAALVIRTALFAWGMGTIHSARVQTAHPARRSVLTTDRHLPWIPPARLALFGLSTFAGLFGLSSGDPSAPLLACISTCVAQMIGRYCFFATCPTPRMPGGVPS